MANPTLVIGSKNFSSWSLRPWLLLRQHGVAFDEVRLPLDTPEFYERIGRYSPTGRVPVLIDGDIVVWDSLAICDYANETWLDGKGWPADRAARALARSVSAEMHSGFQTLRTQLPMNCIKRVSDPITVEARKDVDRIGAIWRDCRSRYDAQGPFLFGTFSIADAMYAPVVTRFVSYGVDVGPIERAYMDAMLELPAMRAWLADAVTEQQAARTATR